MFSLSDDVPEQKQKENSDIECVWILKQEANWPLTVSVCLCMHNVSLVSIYMYVCMQQLSTLLNFSDISYTQCFCESPAASGIAFCLFLLQALASG